MTDLIERLRQAADTASRVQQSMAEAKSLRQDSNPEGRTDLYMWPTPEQTLEGRAATELARQAEEITKLREALEPFARDADRYDPDDEDGLDEAFASHFLIGDLRRARAALTPADKGDGS